MTRLPADDATTLMRLEQDRCRALRDGDAAALRELLADDYRHTHVDGRVDSLEALLAHIASGPPRSTERGALSVTVDGDRATMGGHCVTRIEAADGRPGREISGLAEQGWVRRDERWWLRSFRFTAVDAVREL